MDSKVRSFFRVPTKKKKTTYNHRSHEFEKISRRPGPHFKTDASRIGRRKSKERSQ